ncbi:MAG: leucine-rich repeat domain-containing protein [Breznakibacter sp.]|nr:leucine-rich repeat domain-containing protein [Breznakibacter sp.]
MAGNSTSQLLRKTVACTAGNLSTVLSGYLYDVYDLTVTGTIDARDFKTMRDDMPILRIINLSGATISAYSGNMGTVGNYPTIYPENEVPAWAFSNSYSGIGKPITSFIYPTGITSIDSYAFNNCDKITGLLNLPTTVKSIGKYAFYKCKGFTGALVIPPSVEIIGEHVFDQCTSFTDLTISPLVKTISDYAFYYCTGITSPLALPPSVEIIGKYAFYNCSGTLAS